MDWVLVIALSAALVVALVGNVLQAWFYSKERKGTSESHDDVIHSITEGMHVNQANHSDSLVKLVMEFMARISALEDLAMIEAKERREYLKLAEVKVAERQAAVAKARAEGKAIFPPGWDTPSTEIPIEPDPADEMLARGTRRGKPPPEPKKADKNGEKKEEARA